MLERMQTGRWKVFRHLEDWFQEFRLYHRKEGRVVKLADDLLSASRYAMMMLRHARTAHDDAEQADQVRAERVGVSGASHLGRSFRRYRHNSQAISAAVLRAGDLPR